MCGSLRLRVGLGVRVRVRRLGVGVRVPDGLFGVKFEVPFTPSLYPPPQRKSKGKGRKKTKKPFTLGPKLKITQWLFESAVFIVILPHGCREEEKSCRYRGVYCGRLFNGFRCTLASLSTALPFPLSTVVLPPVARDRKAPPLKRLKQSAW